MERRQNDTDCRHSFLVKAYRDPAAVILHGAGSVLAEGDPDFAAVSGQMFIDGIVDDLIDQMVQTFGSGGTDIHTRTSSDWFESFQNFDRILIINIRSFRHMVYFRYFTK